MYSLDDYFAFAGYCTDSRRCAAGVPNIGSRRGHAQCKRGGQTDVVLSSVPCIAPNPLKRGLTGYTKDASCPSMYLSRKSANPKHANFQAPPEVMKTEEGLMARWRTRALSWMKVSVSHSCSRPCFFSSSDISCSGGDLESNLLTRS